MKKVWTKTDLVCSDVKMFSKRHFLDQHAKNNLMKTVWRVNERFGGSMRESEMFQTKTPPKSRSCGHI